MMHSQTVADLRSALDESAQTHTRSTEEFAREVARLHSAMQDMKVRNRQ